MKEISQKASLYLRAHSPTTVIKITSVPKRGRGKDYFVEETTEVENLLQEFRKTVEIVLERHGYFEEEVYDKNTGKMKKKTVYYK